MWRSSRIHDFVWRFVIFSCFVTHSFSTIDWRFLGYFRLNANVFGWRLVNQMLHLMHLGQNPIDLPQFKVFK